MTVTVSAVGASGSASSLARTCGSTMRPRQISHAAPTIGLAKTLKLEQQALAQVARAYASADLFLFHKTTRRELYDRERAEYAERVGSDLFGFHRPPRNPRGHLARSRGDLLATAVGEREGERHRALYRRQ